MAQAANKAKWFETVVANPDAVASAAMAAASPAIQLYKDAKRLFEQGNDIQG